MYKLNVLVACTTSMCILCVLVQCTICMLLLLVVSNS